MRLMNRAEFAKYVGCTTRHIQNNVHEGEPLFKARQGKTKIDADHPDAKAFFKNFGTKRGGRSHKKPVVKGVTKKELAALKDQVSKELRTEIPKFIPEPVPETRMYDQYPDPDLMAEFMLNLPQDVRDVGNKTINEALRLFGSDDRFENWTKGIKRLEEIEEKRVNTARKKNDLVSQEVVRKGVWAPLSEMMDRLLTDGAKTLARRVRTKIHGGITDTELEEYISNEIGAFIKPARDRISRALRAMG